ncbi:MAG: prepilin-type N-terminal cleavage/methylation domain-containing protein [Tepidisphaeraceae bacterium]
MSGLGGDCVYRRGFTLLEILSVVVVLGIVSAIVIPQIGQRGDLQAAAAARVLVGDLTYAQNRAIATGGWTYVTFDTSAQNYTLYGGTQTAPSSTPLTHPVNQNSYVMTFGGSGPEALANVTLTSATIAGNASTLAFDPTGVPYSYVPGGAPPAPLSSAATAVISCDNYSVTVSIEPATGDISAQ